MFMQLSDLNGKSAEEAVRIIEDYLRSNQELLEYILTHLDSSNIIEIDLSKTNVLQGGLNELQ